MPVLTLEQAFRLAIEQHRTGRSAQAQSLYQQMSATPPPHADGLLLVAVIARELGHREASIEFSKRAISLKPALANVPYQSAIILAALDRRDEAIAAFRQAADQLPDNAEVHQQCATLLHQAGRLDDAISEYRLAISHRPDYSDALSNLGLALKETGQLAESLTVLQRALAIEPDSARTHNNLGNTLEQLNRPREAMASFRRALELEPQLPAAHNNFGNALQRAGLFEEAMAEYARAVELDPDYPEALVNLGNAVKDTGRLSQAIALYRRAVGDRTDFWPWSNLLLAVYYDPSLTPEQVLAEHLRWSKPISAAVAPARQPHTNTKDPQRRLRVGYVSGDFRHHVVGYNILPLFEHHDHERFEIVSYSTTSRCDEITTRFRSMADQWLDVSTFSDAQLIKRIREDQIDILIDLSLHSGANRLPVFAARPAPLQLTFAGYPGTTGLSEIDYRLTDVFLDPPGQNDSFYAERLYRLPHSFWCYQPLSSEPPVGPLPAATKGFITFGSLSNFCKVNDEVLGLWARVLSAMPSSRFLMMCRVGPQRERTLNYLQSFGVDPHRVDFVDYQPRDEYLKTYRRIDIGLDTFPYNGHTTSLDSFWMGVPVITLIGQAAVGRAGFSQLSNLNLGDLAARSPDEFVQIAARLAQDISGLMRLRTRLRQRMESSPLMNAKMFAADIQSAYHALWSKWCASE
ncbi:MAG TPA: tetratricopeptide repeat protein [Tepidisphaeraceae bacterium]|jgi:predicted O-linked N-acetylglucosamine transferase (SPINDLY family)